MFRTARKYGIIAFGLLILLAIVVAVPAMAGPSGSAAAPTIMLSQEASEFRVVVTADVSNAMTSDMQNTFIAISVPSGGRFQEVVTTPAGCSGFGAAGGAAGWSCPSIPAGNSVKFAYKYSVSGKEAGPVYAWMRWGGASAGTMTSDQVSFAKAKVNLPKRGCKDCHELRDANTGAVTIAYEALVRATNHPKISFDTTLEGCLNCHKPDPSGDNTGIIAPKMLRSIVHPAHLNSPAFIGTYKGNCFTCHEVDGNGKFTTLYEAIDTDFRGIPNVPGTMGVPPSEGGR